MSPGQVECGEALRSWMATGAAFQRSGHDSPGHDRSELFVTTKAGVRPVACPTYIRANPVSSLPFQSGSRRCIIGL